MKQNHNLLIALLLLTVFLYSIFIAANTLFPPDSSLSQSDFTSRITLANGNRFEYYDM